jgi:hypothetical protein
VFRSTNVSMFLYSHVFCMLLLSELFATMVTIKFMKITVSCHCPNVFLMEKGIGK